MKNFEHLAKTENKYLFWTLFILVALVALGLRLYRIGSEPLWLDETYSAWFSALPIHDLWHNVPRYETHPPFYYTLLKGWTTVFGVHEAAMRMLSVSMSLVTLLLISLSGRILNLPILNNSAALLAGLFFAINYGAIDYSRQARPYALETMLVTASILLSLKLLLTLTHSDTTPQRRRKVIYLSLGLGLCSGGALWSHNTAVFIMLGIWTGMIVAVLVDGKGRMGEKIIAVGGSGLLALSIWAPYLPLLLAQTKAVAAMSFWIKFQLSDVKEAGYLLSGGRRGLMILTLFTAIYGLYRLLRTQKIIAIHLFCILVIPMLTLVVLSLVSRPVFIARLFEWMSPLICLLMAGGLMQINLKKFKWAMPVLTLLILAMLMVSDYRFFKTPREDWPELINFISEHKQPGDIVVAIPNEITVPLAYYSRQAKDMPPVTFLPGPFPVLGRIKGYVGNLGAPGIDQNDVKAVNTQIKAAQAKRVWLIRRKANIYDPANLIENEVLTTFPRKTIFARTWIQIDLYDDPALLGK